MRDNADLEKENAKLRYLLAKGSDPCIYCDLPANDIARCTDGFPECGRAETFYPRGGYE